MAAVLYSKKLVLITLAMTIAAILGSEPSKANAEGTTLCRMTKDGLKSCMPYVSRGRSEEAGAPSATCCAAISNADISCLCFFKGSTLLAYYGVDSDLAMQLPAKCNLGQAFRCP